MIFIKLFIVAIGIIILWQFGFIERPLTVFLVAAFVSGFVTLIFKNRIHCPFVKKCPFRFCFLHK